MIIEVRINIVTHLEVSPREVNLAIVRIRKLRTLLLWPEHVIMTSDIMTCLT